MTASAGQVSFEAFEFFEKQKEYDQDAHAATARLVWLVSSTYLYVITPGASLFSFTAAGFLLFGMFVASIVMGRCGYWMRRALCAVIIETERIVGPRWAPALRGCGLLLFLAEVMIGYELTKRLFERLVAS